MKTIRAIAAHHPRMTFLAVLIQAASLIGLLWLSRYSRLDIELADYLFDPLKHDFPWRHAWLTEAFGHVWLKMALIVFGSVIVLACLWDAIRPFRRWSPGFRTRMRVLAFAVVLVPLIVGGLKQASALHCPWDIDRYGGTSPYLRLFDVLPAGVKPGKCFPAGHATSALWLVALAVFWLPHRPRKALLVGCVTLTFSFAVGWMQQMRGAHFLSHTLWSMWIACSIVALLYIVSGLWREPT